ATRPDAVDGTNTTDPSGARGGALRPVTERAEGGNQVRPGSTQQARTSKETAEGTGSTVGSPDRVHAADQVPGSGAGAGRPASRTANAGDEVTSGPRQDQSAAVPASAERPGARNGTVSGGPAASLDRSRASGEQSGPRRPGSEADVSASTTQSRGTAAEAGENLLPPAPTEVERPSRWSRAVGLAKEAAVKLGLTAAVTLYTLVPHQQMPAVRAAHSATHTVASEAAAAAHPVKGGRSDAIGKPVPRTTPKTGTSVPDGAASQTGRTPAGAVRPAAPGAGDTVPGTAPRGTAPGDARPASPAGQVDGAQVVAEAPRPEPGTPDAALRMSPPMLVWDRRLQDPGGAAHIRLPVVTIVFAERDFDVRGRVVHADVWMHVLRNPALDGMTEAEYRRPANISAEDWLALTPAQRAEAWKVAGAQAKEGLGVVDAEITDLENKLAELERRIRAYERRTAVVRSKEIG